MPELLERITISPDICHGQPCIRGSRIMTWLVLQYLANGDSAEDIHAAYPSLSPEDIEACLAYAAESAREQIFPIEVGAWARFAQAWLPAAARKCRLVFAGNANQEPERFIHGSGVRKDFGHIWLEPDGQPPETFSLRAKLPHAQGGQIVVRPKLVRHFRLSILHKLLVPVGSLPLR